MLAGAILVDRKSSNLVNTLEVYGRTPLTDPYYERFLNGKAAAMTTLPPQNNLRYSDVFVTLKKEDNSRKLIISTKSMNALVTSSIKIDREVEPEVESSTLKFTPSTDTNIFILSSQIDAANDILTLNTVESLYQHDILSQLRQVRSKFIASNGYTSLRSSSPFTSNHNMNPYTIWTVNNYDDTSTTPSAAKLGSKLFQLIDWYSLNNKYTIKKSYMKHATLEKSKVP